MNLYDVGDPDGRVIGTVLRAQAEALADAPFLRMDDRVLSFGQVNAVVNSYAGGLAELGVGRGDRVSLFMENSLELALLALAANKLGATWVPTNTTYKGEWLRQTLVDADAALVVVDEALLERVLDLGGSFPAKRGLVLGRDATSTEGGNLPARW